MKEQLKQEKEIESVEQQKLNLAMLREELKFRREALQSIEPLAKALLFLAGQNGETYDGE